MADDYNCVERTTPQSLKTNVFKIPRLMATPTPPTPQSPGIASTVTAAITTITRTAVQHYHHVHPQSAGLRLKPSLNPAVLQLRVRVERRRVRLRAQHGRCPKRAQRRVGKVWMMMPVRLRQRKRRGPRRGVFTPHAATAHLLTGRGRHSHLGTHITPQSSRSP